MIWSTPQPIFDALDEEFNFTVDLCADANNKKCYMWLPRDLKQDWMIGDGWAWLNPPYGREIADWVKKAVDVRRKIVAFLPGRTNAPWWHEYVMQAKEIRFVKRKVSFANEAGCKGVPPWGAIVAVFDPAWNRRDPICSSWDWRKR